MPTRKLFSGVTAALVCLLLGPVCRGASILRSFQLFQQGPVQTVPGGRTITINPRPTLHLHVLSGKNGKTVVTKREPQTYVSTADQSNDPAKGTPSKHRKGKTVHAKRSHAGGHADRRTARGRHKVKRK